METSLHRELKLLYAGTLGQVEVVLGCYRIDAIAKRRRRRELVEIQHGPLSAIRDKVRQLADLERVRVVKPIVRIKHLVKRDRKQGAIIERRKSPYRGKLLDIFDDLIYFTRAFPHPNLSLDVVLVDIEEWRYPRPRRGRFSRKNHIVEDQKLLAIHETISIRSGIDLRQLIACGLPEPFHTGDLAQGLDIARWRAQRVAYVLRKAGAVLAVGKKRGAWLYQWQTAAQRRRSA
jgi:hypothetical protein